MRLFGFERMPSRPWPLLALAACITLVFFLPYAAPPSGYSTAALYGFNNRLAIVTLLFAALGFALYTRGLRLSVESSRRSGGRHGRRFMAVVLVIATVAGLAQWLLRRPFPSFMEAAYFLDRYAMYDLGSRLYKDFEFSYGPLMFYPPLLMARALHLRVGDSYLICWIAQWVAGLSLLWWVTGAIQKDLKWRRVIFGVMAATWFGALLDGGANYTPFRFLLAPAVALGVERLYSSRRFALSWAALSLGTGVCLFFSVDQGIALVAGTLLYFALRMLRERRWHPTWLAAYVAAVAGLMWAGVQMGSLSTFQSFNSGALNFPLLPAVTTVPYIVVYFLAACVVISHFRSGQVAHPCMYLLCLSLALVPAAMSRCDAGHLFINQQGALIVVLTAVSTHISMRRWLYAGLVTAASLGLLAHTWQAWSTSPSMLRELAFSAERPHPAVKAFYVRKLTLQSGAKVATERAAKIDAALNGDATHVSRPPTNTLVFAPFSAPRQILPTRGNLRIATGRYVAFQPDRTSYAAERIDEIKSRSGQMLLMPTRDKELGGGFPCGGSIGSGRNAQSVTDLKALLITPFVPSRKREPLDATELCDFIVRNYTPSNFIAPNLGWELWTPR